MKEGKEFQVICVPHGVLGIVGQAHLGLTLFDAHRREVDGCQEAKVTLLPQDVRWFQRRQARRITKTGK